MIKRFEDIVAWKKGRELCNLVYPTFRIIKDSSFRDQIQRASVSIMNNISEGFERGTKKEFIRFLFFSKGSCGEVRSMVNLAKDLGYISDAQKMELLEKCEEISKILSGLIKSVR